MVYFAPPPITAEEVAGAEEIRRKVANIPNAFNTNYYLARWWRAYNGDINRIKKNMKDLFDHRQVLGYDQIETDLLQTKLEIAKKTFERFCISKIALYRRANNVCVFVQRMIVNDMDEIVKVIPFSYVLHSYFILQEAFTRAQLETEKITDSPAVVASILDLSGVNFTNLLNPFSISAQFVRLIVKVWADYFIEAQGKLFLINSPVLINVLGQVAKLLMDKRTQSRIQFLNHPNDLLKYLNPTLVPAAYGGTWRDESGYAEYPEYVCQSPVKILPQHYYDQDLLWQKHGFTKLPLLNFENIKAMKTFEIKKTCKSNMQTLLWHFTVSSDVEFSIVKIDQDGNEAIAWPKITLMSLKAPEQGSITCNPGEYVIRFTNPSRFWLPVKLYFVVSLCPKNV